MHGQMDALQITVGHILSDRETHSRVYPVLTCCDLIQLMCITLICPINVFLVFSGCLTSRVWNKLNIICVRVRLRDQCDQELSCGRQ